MPQRAASLRWSKGAVTLLPTMLPVMGLSGAQECGLRQQLSSGVVKTLCLIFTDL